MFMFNAHSSTVLLDTHIYIRMRQAANQIIKRGVVLEYNKIQYIARTARVTERTVYDLM